MVDRELEAAGRSLSLHWGIPPGHGAGADVTWQLLLDALAERITDLYRNNYQKLLNAMYVLDISEHRYREAMGLPDLEQKAYALAQIVLERETEKIRTRAAYARGQRRPLPGDTTDTGTAPPEHGTRR